jgi:hypothetical protein
MSQPTSRFILLFQEYFLFFLKCHKIYNLLIIIQVFLNFFMILSNIVSLKEMFQCFLTNYYLNWPHMYFQSCFPTLTLAFPCGILMDGPDTQKMIFKIGSCQYAMLPPKFRMQMKVTHVRSKSPQVFNCFSHILWHKRDLERRSFHSRTRIWAQQRG